MNELNRSVGVENNYFNSEGTDFRMDEQVFNEMVQIWNARLFG